MRSKFTPDRGSAATIFCGTGGGMSLGEFGVRYVEDRGIGSSVALEHGLDETAPEPDIIKARLAFRSSPEQIREKFCQVNSMVWFPVPRPEGLVNYVARINGIYRDGEGKEVRFLFSQNGRRVPWIPDPTL